jgi:hypothetical protein
MITPEELEVIKQAVGKLVYSEYATDTRLGWALDKVYKKLMTELVEHAKAEAFTASFGDFE